MKGRLPGFLLMLLCGFTLRADLLVGTWNLQNYLLAIRFPEGRFRPDYPKPEAEKRLIRELLLVTRPDILFLQELGSPGFLLELQLDLAAQGLVYPHGEFSALPDSRSGLAFLSRFPPDLAILHQPSAADGSSPSIPRGVQEVRFTVRGRLWRFYHVHLKSRWSEDPADPDATIPRRAGIRTLAGLLERLFRADPRGNAILVGDFNTPHGSPLLDPLRPHWLRLLPEDGEGLRYTYTHRKSGSREILDGFWVRPPLSLQPVALLPEASRPAPSDHRLVLARLVDPAGPTDN